jgi:hypothetical protein
VNAKSLRQISHSFAFLIGGDEAAQVSLTKTLLMLPARSGCPFLEWRLRRLGHPLTSENGGQGLDLFSDAGISEEVRETLSLLQGWVFMKLGAWCS